MSETAREEINTIQAGEASANASSRHILRNVATQYLSTGTSMAVSFFVTPLLIRKLGPDQFGLWTLLLATVMYLGLFDLGIGTAVAKRVADCHATGDQTRLANVLGTALAIYVVLATGLMAATFALAPWMGQILKLPPAVQWGARLALIILAANQAMVFIYNVQASVLYGAGRLDLLTRASVVSNVLVALSNVVLVLRGYGVVTLAIIMAVSTVFLSITTYFLISRYFPGSRLRLSRATWPMVRELMISGLRNAGLQLSAAVSYGADAMVVKSLMPLSAVTDYAIASKLVGVVKNIATKPVGMLLPAYAHCDAIGDRERQFRLFTRGVNFSLGLALPVSVIMFIFGDRLVDIWAGAGHSASYPALAILAGTLLVQLQSYAACILSQATERSSFLLKMSAGSAVANILLSFFFTWRLGVVGPALGSLCCVLVVDGVLIPRHTCWQMGRRTSEYLRVSILPLILPTALAAAVLLLARFCLPLTVPYLISASLASGLVFLGAWNPAVFTGEGSLRQRLLAMVCFA